MSQRSNKRPLTTPPDKTLVVVVTFLIIIGFLAIFSATAPKCLYEGVNPAQFLGKQFISFIIGGAGLLFFIRYDYKKLSKWNTIYAIAILVALILVEATPLGVYVNGAKRWINLGFMQLQPSEFAKPAVVMLLASAFCKDARVFVQSKFLNMYLYILAMIALIYMQPNLSMVLLLLATSVVMYLCGGGSLKLFFTLVMGGLAAILIAAKTIIKPYQMERILIWRHPEIDPHGAGYNIIQSLIAFASGNLTGVGYGGSIQKLYYLPECHTDFIFAVFAEEMGLVGSLLIIGLFFTFIQRGIVIAGKCPDMYGKLLAIGITFSIGFQAFLNMSVASSFLPATGVPLPFISYGGSSLIVSMCMVGVLLNISKKRIQRIRNVQVEQQRQQ